MYKPIDKKNNEYMGVNNIWSTLKLEKYFEDISDTDEILRTLYVNYTRKDGPIAEQDPAINKAYPDVLETEGIHTAGGSVEIPPEELRGKAIEDLDCAYLGEFIQNAFKRDKDSQGRKMQIRRTRTSKRLLVILAGIGEGKTTLLDYFFKVWVRKNEDYGNVIRLNIDFEGKDDIKPSKLTENYLADILRDKIREEYPELFEDKSKLRQVLEERLKAQKGLLDLMEDRQGPEARKKEEWELIRRFHRNSRIFVPSLINYLVNEGNKKVVVTLDNVDRLRNAECQYKAVTLAHEALQQWDCCVIVCVREYTYGNLWLMGRWGFQRPLLYHKRPPRFASVLQRRFEKFPLEKYVSKPSFYIRGKLVKIEEVKRFVKNIAKVLWSRDMERSLFRLNNGDVRQMLDMVKAFLSFHALDMEGLFTATFLKSREEARKIRALTINFDNFVRAITVGNYRYYCLSDPYSPAAQQTFVLNMIGGPQDMPLLPYRILTYLRKYELVHVKPLIEKACRMGVTKQAIEDVLESFLKSYLIESMQGVYMKDVEEVVITRKGVYYFDVLSALGKYIENVMNDAWWDKRIKPYEQHYSLKEEGTFLKECIEQIFQAETKEYKKIEKKYWVMYKEFLDENPYCERLGESILLHLGNLKSRDAVLPDDILRDINEQLDEIREAKEDKCLPCGGTLGK